jgi:hypothetical protein
MIRSASVAETAEKRREGWDRGMTHTRRALGALAVVGLLALAACGPRRRVRHRLGHRRHRHGRADTHVHDGSAGEGPEVRAVHARARGRHGRSRVHRDGGMSIQIQGGPGDMAKIDAAQEACREFAPFGGDGTAPAPDPEMEENMRKFAQCMRDNGVPDFPDPDGRACASTTRSPPTPTSRPRRRSARPSSCRTCRARAPRAAGRTPADRASASREARPYEAARDHLGGPRRRGRRRGGGARAGPARHPGGQRPTGQHRHGDQADTGRLP